MPAKSKAQQMFMGSELRRRRQGMRTKTGMNEEKLEHFAGTKRKGLISRAVKNRKNNPHKY